MRRLPHLPHYDAQTVEQAFLAYLRGRCRHLPQVAVGIGDDAAVINPSDGQLVACTDQIIDGTDFDSRRFELDGHRWADVGFKSIAINLSDMAAMGGKPRSVLVTIALPNQNPSRIAGDVYEGILEAAAEYDLAIAGGDISVYDGPLSISVTLLGSVPSGKAWLRSGAQEGDAIFVSGAVGGSLRGRHLRPQPRIELAKRIRELEICVHAAIDISDGLSLDLDRLCASSGVGAELDAEAIPIHADAIERAQETGCTPWEHAWRDGEDFELIVTMNQEDAKQISKIDLGVPLTCIGEIVGRTGMWKRNLGKLERLMPQGYVHGKSSTQANPESS
ncbi:MAG: thiamine-phosphate kinase [Rubripirellula sp.]